MQNKRCRKDLYWDSLTEFCSVLPWPEWVHPGYLTYMQNTSCKRLGWMNHKLESIAGRNINNLGYAEDTTLMAENKEELLIVREWKSWLKTHHLKNKDLVPSFHGKNMGKNETMTDFIFLGSKITADGDCSHESKRRLLLGRKAVTNLDSVLESRHVTLLTNEYRLKAMVLPVVVYGHESWTTKKAEHQRTDASKLWC